MRVSDDRDSIKPDPDLLEPHFKAEHELIALGNRTKVPRERNWPKCTPLAPRQATAHMCAGGNVGVRLRRTDLILDVDPRNFGPPSDGRNTFQQFTQRFHLDPSEWPQVCTGGGGTHYYLRKPAELEIVKGLSDFPGIEFKSAGSQVVACGSIHPETGNLYQPDPLQDELLNAPQAPAPLLEAITRHSRSRAAAEGAITPENLGTLLSGLDPRNFREHDQWLEIMMASHHGTAGAGLEEFVHWSISDPNYAGHTDIITQRWNSLEQDRSNPITIASLYKRLSKAGRGDLIDMIKRVPAAKDFPIDHPMVPDLPPKLRQTRDGRIVNTLENCLRLIERSGLGLAWDELAQRPMIMASELPWKPDIGRELTEDVVRVVRHYILEEYKVEFTKENVFEACMTLAREHGFNPVVDFLNSISWDQQPRIDRWLSEYLGADDTPYTRAVGRLVLIAAVRRAKQPGCKFDQVVILEGAQGTGKSSALRILGGRWHADAELGRFDNKEAPILLQGAWLFELGELTSMNRTEVGALKAFVSRSEDRYRAPYDRAPKAEPRRCVFIGTTNSDAYLRDLTGNRRFWPIKTTKIDLEALKRDRDQLWAEAAHVEPSESLMLPEELWAAASAEQQSRLAEDPWAERIAVWLETSGATRVHASVIMGRVLGVDASRENQALGKRLRDVMQHLGWTYRRGIRIEGVVGSGYMAPDANS